MANDLGELQSRLGYRFDDPELLIRALTHRSYIHETEKRRAESYETLEFLGDSLLGFLVSDRLCRDDSSAPEGVLSRRKQMVVRTSTLAVAARKLGLGEVLRLGRGEQVSGGARKSSILAAGFEAVLAAVYLDGGLRPARAFTKRHLRQALLDAGRAAEVGEDHKTRLQELTQGEQRVTPKYRIVATSGPAHDRSFDVEVVLSGRVLASGSGRSRKEAEQAAAGRALAAYRRAAQ